MCHWLFRDYKKRLIMLYIKSYWTFSDVSIGNSKLLNNVILEAKFLVLFTYKKEEKIVSTDKYVAVQHTKYMYIYMV